MIYPNGDESRLFVRYESRLRALAKTSEAISKAVNAFGINNGGVLELWRFNSKGGCYTLRIPIKE